MKMKMIGAYDEDSHSVFVVASFNGLVRIVILNDLFHFRVVIDGLNYGQGLFIQFLVRDRRVLQTNKERNNKTNNFEKSRLSLYRQKTNKQNNKTTKQQNKTKTFENSKLSTSRLSRLILSWAGLPVPPCSRTTKHVIAQIKFCYGDMWYKREGSVESKWMAPSKLTHEAKKGMFEEHKTTCNFFYKQIWIDQNYSGVVTEWSYSWQWVEKLKR